MNKEDKNTLFWMGVILVSLIAAIIIHLYQYPLTSNTLPLHRSDSSVFFVCV